MSEVEVVEVNCPVCESTDRNRLFQVADYAHPQFRERFGVCRCTVCGCAYLSPRPRRTDMHRYYDEDFYWNYEGGTSVSAEATLAIRMPQIRAKRKYIDDLTPGRLLDIGAMKGEFIYTLREDGWQAEGLDFSTSPRNLFNVPIKYGEFLDLNYEQASFDCITMWAVLEHVYDPSAYIAKITRLLKPGGRFVGLVTNFNSVQGRLLRGDDYPRHLCLFTHASLQRLLRSHGLRPDLLRTNQEVFSGSLYGALVHSVKRAAGYATDEICYERRSLTDSHAFCCKWRGKDSAIMKWVSRGDRVLSLPLERLLDQLGFGFILTCVAHKSSI